MQYCLYLRKSRSDLDAEAHGETETLARHEKALLELAKRLHLNITQIYREVVSGETIASRPVMQQLLSEVEQGVWTGVLVMEVERLARGDTVDQGIVAQTFKYSDTKIITPVKTYDPQNEFDEEYFEFGLFMSRREYKTINRRLQRGRLASVKEGKYICSIPPFGYRRVRLEKEKGWTLEINEEEADIVRLIYQLYTEGDAAEDGTTERLGCGKIVRRLNNLGVKPRKGGKTWSVATIRDILINPVYCGKIKWNWRVTQKKMVDGKRVMSRPRSALSDIMVTKGLHPAIISEETYNKSIELMSKNPPHPIPERKKVMNPLAGLVICGMCGKRMVRRPYQNRSYPDALMCADTGCPNVSTNLAIVEKRIIEALGEWLSGYKLKWDIPDAASPVSVSLAAVKRKALEKNSAEIDLLEKQLSRTHDLLEQGVYDTDTFLQRSRELSVRITEAKTVRETLEKEVAVEQLREESAANIVPAVERVLELYYQLPTAKAKNDLLKEVLEKVVYIKEKSAHFKGVNPDDFEITIYPKIPQFPAE